jgi:hypothetical protein
MLPPSPLPESDVRSAGQNHKTRVTSTHASCSTSAGWAGRADGACAGWSAMSDSQCPPLWCPPTKPAPHPPSSPHFCFHLFVSAAPAEHPRHTHPTPPPEQATRSASPARPAHHHPRTLVRQPQAWFTPCHRQNEGLHILRGAGGSAARSVQPSQRRELVSEQQGHLLRPGELAGGRPVAAPPTSRAAPGIAVNRSNGSLTRISMHPSSFCDRVGPAGRGAAAAAQDACGLDQIVDASWTLPHPVHTPPPPACRTPGPSTEAAAGSGTLTSRWAQVGA